MNGDPATRRTPRHRRQRRSQIGRLRARQYPRRGLCSITRRWHLLSAECANVLWKKLRRRELSKDEADIAAQTLEQADITVASTRGYFALTTAVAGELDHPAYDAVNLAVAEASELRLVTADDTLIRKVRQGQSRFRHVLVALSEIA
jgi:predicted nucleic acid-binding protein